MNPFKYFETEKSKEEISSENINKSNAQKRILKNFFIGRQIGRGNFGKIFEGSKVGSKVSKTQSYRAKTGSQDSETYAIKCQPLETSCLTNETSIYKTLNPWGNTQGFPIVYSSGSEGNNQYMVMEMLGKNLQNLFAQNNQRFNLKTILKIGLQILDRLQHMHSKGYIHLDLKPANFLIGLKDKKSIIHITDFGLSKRYKQKLSQKHIPFSLGNQRWGTVEYCSVSCHLRYQQSRRDDIQSLFYTLLYFLKGGKLPWSNVKGFNINDQWNRVLKLKQNNSLIKKACQEQHFLQLWSLIQYSRNLKFQQNPQYKYIRTILTEKLQTQNDETQDPFP